MPAVRDYELIAADDCPVCRRANALVAPDCADGHGTDCPDRVCLNCGSALFVDPMMRAPRRRAPARIA